MEVALDGAHGAAQGLGQGLHLGPAQTTLVVGVVSEGTICRDRLGWDSSVSEVLDLRNTGKLGLLSHRRLLFSSAAVRFDDKIHQSGGFRAREIAPPLFLCFFSGAYSTYTGSPALAPSLAAWGSH